MGRNLHPDHATLARFRATFQEPLAGLFSTVLALCVQAGVIDLALVAVDGTKMEANASLSSNHSADGFRKLLEAEARRILDEAAAVDAAEDAISPPPRLLIGRERRRERIREALAELQAERERAEAEVTADREQRAHAKAEGRAKRGRPKGGGAPVKPRQINLTDPDSRIMCTKGRWVQAYNAQVAVTADQIILAAELFVAASDAELLAPTMAAMTAQLADLGVDDRPDVVVADAGYWSAANASLDIADTLLIATTKAWKMCDKDRPPQAPVADNSVDRCALIERVEAGEMLARDAAKALGVSEPTISRWRSHWRAGARSIPTGEQTASDTPSANSTTPISEKAEIRRRMEQRLRTENGAALYKRRSPTVEPVFGQIKTNRRIDRFHRRGLAACAAEWKLIAATHNLLKLWRRLQPA